MSCEMKMAVLDEATNIQIFFLITLALTTSRTLKVKRNNDKRKKVGEIRSEIKIIRLTKTRLSTRLQENNGAEPRRQHSLDPRGHGVLKESGFLGAKN